MSYSLEWYEDDASSMVPAAEGNAEAVFWTFEMVEGRLVEALLIARRIPDREAGWLSVRSFWPPIVRDRALGDYDIRGYLGTTDDMPRPRAPLNAAEIARMEEAENWLGRWLEEDDRALVVLALGWRAAGRRIGWRRVRAILGSCISEAALAKRYSLAVATIACGLSGKGASAVQSMVRHHRAQAARDAIRDGGFGRSVEKKGRRRRTEYVISYSDMEN